MTPSTAPDSSLGGTPQGLPATILPHPSPLPRRTRRPPPPRDPPPPDPPPAGGEGAGPRDHVREVERELLAERVAGAQVVADLEMGEVAPAWRPPGPGRSAFRRAPRRSPGLRRGRRCSCGCHAAREQLDSGGAGRSHRRRQVAAGGQRFLGEPVDLKHTHPGPDVRLCTAWKTLSSVGHVRHAVAAASSARSRCVGPATISVPAPPSRSPTASAGALIEDRMGA